MPSEVYFPYKWDMKSSWSGGTVPLERNSYTPLSGTELKSPQMMTGILEPSVYTGGGRDDALFSPAVGVVAVPAAEADAGGRRGGYLAKLWVILSTSSTRSAA